MDYKGLLESSLKEVFSEFEKMGQQIQSPTLVDRYLIAATYKASRLVTSIVLLCENGKAEDALIILRSLIEHTINMRWILKDEPIDKIKTYVNAEAVKGFGVNWTTVNLNDRMTQVGFKDKDYFDFCVKLTYAYAHVNSSSLRWREVCDGPRLNKDGWPPDALYQVAIQMLGHIMLALNTRYPDYFKDYEELWGKIPVDKDIRKKLEKVKEEFTKNDDNKSICW